MKRILAVISFLFLLLSCRSQQDTTLYFNEEMVLDFGSDDTPIMLIEKIGDTEVTEDMIDGNTIRLGTFEVTCESDVDTYKTGDYEVRYVTNDTTNRYFTKIVTVKDISAPVISFGEDGESEEIELSLEEYQSYDFASYITVTDNYTEQPAVTIEIDGSIEAGKTYQVSVHAADRFGNESDKTFDLIIRDEPDIIEPSKENEVMSNGSDASNSQTQGGSSSISSNSGSNSNTQPSSSSSQNPSSPPETSKPQEKIFLYSDGYTQANVAQACLAELQASGRGGGCYPITDENGLYIGMRLTYY